MTSKTDSAQRDDFINYFSQPPSLQHISAVSIAINLWNNCLLSDRTDLSELKKRILERLSGSSWPTSLKTAVSYVIPHIKLELSKVFCSDCRCTGYDKIICDYFKKGGQIFWTVEGTIDIEKSIIEIISCENSENDVSDLFEVACYYCLEEYVSVLWKKIPVQIKSQLKTDRGGGTYKYPMYWISVLENDLDTFLNKLTRFENERMYGSCSINVNMVTFSIRTDNRFALKYFWDKLPEPDRDSNLNKWLLQASKSLKYGEVCKRDYKSLDVLCFLLSQISCKIDLIEFFQDHSDILLLFFNWPFQRIFLLTILEVLDNLSEGVYVYVMKELGSKISKKIIQRPIFREIWSVSPLRLKRSFLQNKMHSAEVLMQSLQIGDSDMALSFINDASEKEIKQIVCCMFGLSEFRYYIHRKDLKLLNRLLSQTTLPPECFLHEFRFNHQEREDTGWHYNQWHLCYEWIFKGNFQIAEAFFKWTFQSADELQDFKTVTLDPHFIYVSFIIMCDYKRIEQFLNWYFSSDEEIRKFKKDFIHDGNNSHFKFLLCELCSRPNIARNVLEGFFSSSLLSPEEIIELKSICLNYVETVLLKKKYEFATILLHLSLEIADKVKQYKNNFILSENGIKFCQFSRNLLGPYNKCKDMEILIKWSLPLYKETISELKTLFHTQDPSYFCNRATKLQDIALLDSLVEGESTPEFESSSNYNSHQSL